MTVQQQAGGDARWTEIADELRLVNGQKSLDSLYLDDEFDADYEVHPVAAFELDAFVADRQGFLTLEAQPARVQGMLRKPTRAIRDRAPDAHLDARTDDHA